MKDSFSQPRNNILLKSAVVNPFNFLYLTIPDILILKFKFMKYTLSTIALILLISCGKDKNNNQPQQPTKTELITKSSWKYESGGVDQDKNGTFDISFATLGILQP